VEDGLKKLKPYFIWLLVIGLLAGCQPASDVAQAVSLPGLSTATATPFLPDPNFSLRAAVPPSQSAVPTLPDASGFQPDYFWNGIDFKNFDQKIKIVFHPPSALVNIGRPLSIEFQPGWPCQFKDHRACVTVQPGRGAESTILLVTVHSGVGGDGEAFRNAIEGSGINAAFFSLDRIQRGMNELQDTPVQVNQGIQPGRDGKLLAVARVPAGQVSTYFHSSAVDALDLGAQNNPAMEAALQLNEPLVIIETCGWRHPDEKWAPGVSDTTGSVYLIVLGKG
jgi:hypothetical protein